jgi:hypothetical protein
MLAGLLLLAACGPYLGHYRFERVDLVLVSRLEAIDAGEVPDPHSGQLLRIVFTSDVDVETASGGTGSGLYIQADFCPFRDWRLLVSGPYYGDLSPFPPTPPAQQLANGVVLVPSIANRHPPRDGRTGRFVYTAYIAPSRVAAPSPGSDVQPYDLHGLKKDLCLRLDHPGYYLTASRSSVFVVPAGAIRAALASDKRGS